MSNEISQNPSVPSQVVAELKFPKFINNLGIIPTSYKDSMSYYECLAWLCKYLEETVIPTLNQNGMAVEELQTLFVELKSYVEHYFDDLDIQTEVNNKLDEMAESGQLSDIIAQYLQLAGLLCYNTLADLKNASNIINGSFCKTLGKYQYNDTFGAIYKIRQITSDDIIDDDNIIQLSISNLLIGEKIHSFSNNKMNSIDLQNNIIYDSGNTYYFQGMCYDTDHNKLYVYQNIDNTYGNLLIFDIENYTLLDTIQNVKLYHGGDLHYSDNHIYCSTSSGSKMICILDLTNNSIEEITPFEEVTEFTEVIGISDFDKNNLIVGLTVSPPTLNFSNYALYKLNKTNYSITNIPIITNGFNFDFYCFQCLQTLNNKLYVLISYPNMIAEFIYKNNSYELLSIYNLPTYDNLGIFCGEYEGLALIENNKFILSSHIIDNTIDNYKTLKTYIFDFNSQLQNPRYKFNVEDIYLNNREKVIVDNSNSTVFYENGSTSYPFKTINRALAFVNKSSYAKGKQILIKTGNYKIGKIYNMEAIINADSSSNSTNITITGYTYLLNCNLTFNSDTGENSNTRLITMNNIIIDGGNIKLRQVILNHTIVCSHSNLSLYKCESLETSASVITLRDSICHADVGSWASSGYYFELLIGAVVFLNTNISNTKINRVSSVVWVIKSNQT